MVLPLTNVLSPSLVLASLRMHHQRIYELRISNRFPRAVLDVNFTKFEVQKIIYNSKFREGPEVQNKNGSVL